MAAPNRFVERLENGPPIVGDGGMGALVTSAVPRLRTPEEANLRAPDAVVSLHVGFIQAGGMKDKTDPTIKWGGTAFSLVFSATCN